ncbi:hypothetical protein B1J93_00025 [Leptospira kirschneri serovar Pomona]|uniref:Uncharacterized protein n=1 Tax=Leptospira kirschneri serovar Pomona TaxID=561005 RepID=A0A1T1E6A2_9LEPT|nr:hypothetical protein [Leptospira kirschneri]OOV48608.1 hypothetical protein B1J93_00025 [Leptospira kirschneri serovar Pomona]
MVVGIYFKNTLSLFKVAKRLKFDFTDLYKIEHSNFLLQNLVVVQNIRYFLYSCWDLLQKYFIFV